MAEQYKRAIAAAKKSFVAKSQKKLLHKDMSEELSKSTSTLAAPCCPGGKWGGSKIRKFANINHYFKGAYMKLVIY